MGRKGNLKRIHVCRFSRDGVGVDDPAEEVILDGRAGTSRESVALAGRRRRRSQLITFQEVAPELVVGVVEAGGFVWIVWNGVC